MGRAITIIVARIPTAKPEGIARDTERDSQKSGRAGVRKGIHLVVRTEMITRVCMNLTISDGVRSIVQTPTLYIYSRGSGTNWNFNSQLGPLRFYW